MIQTRELSVDEEVMIYLSTFFHQNKDLPLPHQIPSRPLSKSPSISSISGKTICYRCGQVGHLANQCPNELPDPSEIKAEMNNEISELIDKLRETGNYDSDEFGLFYKNGPTPVSVDGKNWSNATFCPNCGFMHPQNKCPHVGYNELYSEMKNTFNNKSYSSEQIKNFFNDIWES